MGKIITPSLPTDSNYKYKEMRFPARPFVQMITGDEDKFPYAPGSRFIDMFNVPYNYFTDLSVNCQTSGGQGFLGSMTILNPWPLSTRDYKRFHAFDRAVQRMARITMQDTKAAVDDIAKFDTAFRWGWKDAIGDYYCSMWSRFRVTNISLSMGEGGIQYQISFINPPASLCEKVTLDRDVVVAGSSGSSEDLILSTSQVFYKYNMLLDFTDEDSCKAYRCYEYEDDGSVKLNADGPVVSETGRIARKESLALNDAMWRTFATKTDMKLSDMLSGGFKCICLKKHILEPTSNSRDIINVFYDSRMDKNMGFNSIVNPGLSKLLTEKEINDIQSEEGIGFFRIQRTIDDVLPRIYLRFDPVSHQSKHNKDVSMKLFANGNVVKLMEKHEKSDVYKSILNSRDCGLYRYYSGSGTLTSGGATISEVPISGGYVMESNITSISIDVKTWLYTYLGNNQEIKQIGTNNGLVTNTGVSRSEKDASAGTPAESDPASNKQTSEANAKSVASVKQAVINEHMSTGRIDILGDPSICLDALNLYKKIHIMVYTPIGEPLQYWSGLYTVTGYSHNISEGRYTTSIDVIGGPFNKESIEADEVTLPGSVLFTNVTGIPNA